MNRLSLLHKLDDLLEICKTCEKNNSGTHSCQGCSTYGEIREIGENLGRKKEMARGNLEMTVEEFVELKFVKKLPFTKIAQLKGVADPTIHHWKNKHIAEIEKAFKALGLPTRAEKKTSETKTTQEDKTAEYERLIQALRNDLKEAHTQLDEKDEVLRKYENITAACDDVENETATLREEKHKLQEECGRLLDKQYEDDYRLENMKQRVDYFVKKVEDFEKENKALRELVKLWS